MLNPREFVTMNLHFLSHTEQGIITHVSGNGISLIPAIRITSATGPLDFGLFSTSTIRRQQIAASSLANLPVASGPALAESDRFTSIKSTQGPIMESFCRISQ